MALTDMLRKTKQTPVEHLQAVVDRLLRERDTAQERLTQAELDYSNALFEAAANDGLPPARVVDVLTKVKQAREDSANAEVALLMGQSRLRSAQLAEVQRTVTDRWAKGIKAVDARNDAFVELQDRIDGLIQTWSKVLTLTAQMESELPAIPDRDAAITGAHQLGELLRVELWRQGFAWAAPRSASQRVTTPQLADAVAGIPGMVRRWRDEAAGGQ